VGDPDVMAFLGGTLSREQIIVKLESEVSSLQTHGIQYWPLFAKADGAFVGCCGLKLWTYSNHGSHELGFHLVKESWGKGYAPEASFAVIEFAKSLGIKYLRAGHHPHNLSSKKVLEKLGFEFFETKFFPPTGLMHPSYCLVLR
jgi:[ribosomal protein S5]-alanine N-acetyltransferase